jgi:hypothetical protein
MFSAAISPFVRALAHELPNAALRDALAIVLLLARS